MAPTQNPRPIGLAELIRQVRAELMTAVQMGPDAVPLLAVDGVDLEVGVTVTAKVEGGIQIHVVQLGAGGERSDVHRVSVHLAPLLSLEERVAELRKDGRWNEVVKQQVEHTLKGLQEPDADSY